MAVGTGFGINYFTGIKGKKVFEMLMPGGVLSTLPSDQAAQSIVNNALGNKATQDDIDEVKELIDIARNNISQGVNSSTGLSPSDDLNAKYKLKDQEADLLRTALRLDPKAVFVDATLAGVGEGAKFLGKSAGDNRYRLAQSIISSGRGMSKQLPSAVEAYANTAANAQMHKGKQFELAGEAVSNLANALRANFNIHNTDLRGRVAQTYAPISAGQYDYERKANDQLLGR